MIRHQNATARSMPMTGKPRQAGVSSLLPIAAALLAVLAAGAPASSRAQAQAQTAAPAAFAPAIVARNLVASFRTAKESDPQYRAALSEKVVNETAALSARLAYTPTLSYTNQPIDTDSTTRRTLNITQPLLDAGRYLTTREGEPRTRLADATLIQREQDLAQRLLKSVTDIVRAREGLRTNENRISLLDEQARRAQRMFELNEGTITDQRDTAVRREQARATQLGLVTRLRVAENQFNAIVGARPAPEAFRIADVPRRIPLDSVDTYLQGGQETNPLLVNARQNERLAEINGQRARAALLPTVSVLLQQSNSSGKETTYTGIVAAFPLNGQTVVQVNSAGAQAERARELRRDVEQKLQVDIERLRAQVDSGQQELAIRKDAILSAELAVQANIKSQQGGIRNSVDVLNAIQTLSDVRNEYAGTAATLAEDYLNLLLQSALDPTDALEKVQQTIFAN